MRAELRQYLGTARLFERKGELWLTLPRKLIRLYGLRAGDVMRWRKLPRQVAWQLTFIRRGRKLQPSGKFKPSRSSFYNSSR